MKRARFTKTGPLAIASAFWGVEIDVREPEPFRDENGVAVVTICGPLTHHPEWFFDSYDAIVERVRAALASQCTAVVLDIDSPGGDVAGCFELAAELREMARASGKRFVAFTDGMAASAAYALATSAPEIYVTATGQVGSIGVINALVDVTALDRAQGIKFSVISSGERKKDGNPHVPITDEAEAVLRSNVNALAGLFFDWVSRTRPALSAETLQSFDGGLFFGTNAVKVGLANAVTTKSELLATLARAPSASAAETNGATMADEKDKQDAPKSYEDEMRAKLEEDSKSDDEKKASAAKKMLAALDGDGDPDKDGDKDKPAEKSEEEKKKDDEKAKALAAASPVIAELVATTASQASQIKELQAKAEAEERAKLYATRTDVPAETLKALDKLPLAQAREIFATIPAAIVDPAAAMKAKPTQGAGGPDGARLPPAEATAMQIAMGMRGETRKVSRENNEVFFPAMTPAEAKAQLDARAKEGAK